VGLLGGPLYSLYKALTAVELARVAGSMLGRPVVALFWMDAEDHDFEEVRSATLIDTSQELVTLSYQPEEFAEGVSVGTLRLEPSIEEIVTQAADALAPSEFKNEIVDGLRESYAPGRTLAEAFGSWLLRMTSGTGLAVVDPNARTLKSIAASLFQRETSERSESTRLVEETTERLVSEGYHAQAGTADNRLNLHYADPVRSHITFEDSGFRLSADRSAISLEEVQRLVDEEPERFSANVILRPLLQDHLLPTLAYVGGPNELAYIAQLGEVYRHFAIPMPLVVPRASITVVEKGAAKFLSRHPLKLGDLRANDESVLNDILKDLAPPQLDEDLSRARTCIQEITETLERDLAAVDATLGSTARSTRGKLLHHLGELETKSRRAIKKKNDTLRRQFFAARTALFPNFEMQERQLSPVQYLTKYGWYFSEMVRKNIDLEEPGHVLIFP
jgi:bacillithiol biosynthesis cysteine-adding enzyme BshC